MSFSPRKKSKPRFFRAQLQAVSETPSRSRKTTVQASYSRSLAFVSFQKTPHTFTPACNHVEDGENGEHDVEEQQARGEVVVDLEEQITLGDTQSAWGPLKGSLSLSLSLKVSEGSRYATSRIEHDMKANTSSGWKGAGPTTSSMASVS